MVHRLRDLGDLDQTVHREVNLLSHHANDHGELIELIGLRRSQWMLFEERDDAARQISESSHIISVEMLSMIVMTSIDEHITASEVPLHLVQHLHAPRSLHYDERRLSLPAETIGRIAEDRNAEAAFTVDEADDPLLDPWPFLLIARTGRVFTAHVETLSRPTDMNEYRRILGCPST